MNMETTEFDEILEFMCEAIENGYNYSKVIHEISMSYDGIDNTKKEQLLNIMYKFENNEHYPTYIEIELMEILPHY